MTESIFVVRGTPPSFATAKALLPDDAIIASLTTATEPGSETGLLRMSLRQVLAAL